MRGKRRRRQEDLWSTCPPTTVTFPRPSVPLRTGSRITQLPALTTLAERNRSITCKRTRCRTFCVYRCLLIITHDLYCYQSCTTIIHLCERPNYQIKVEVQTLEREVFLVVPKTIMIAVLSEDLRRYKDLIRSTNVLHIEITRSIVKTLKDSH